MILAKTNKRSGSTVADRGEGELSLHHGEASARCRVLYVINGLERGGAEMGLKTLVEQRLFSDVDLQLLLIHKGDEQLYQSLLEHPDVGRIYVADAHSGLRALGMCKALWFLLRHCAAGRCHLLIASLAQANIIALLVSKLIPSVKVASFFHNTSYSKRIYEKLVRALSSHIDYGFYDNVKTYEAVRNKLPEKAAREWFYLPLFISQEITAKDNYDTAGPIKIFSAGRLNEQKNYLEALQAIRLLVDDGCDVKFFIAGEGDLWDTLYACRQRLQLEPYVELMGYQENWQAQAQKMDIYLLASTREGLSIATLEAMSYGLPVVATNVGGIQEYGQHLRNMVVVESPEAPAIAAGLKQLVISKELRARVGRAARDTASQLFGQQAVKAEYETVKQALFRS